MYDFNIKKTSVDFIYLPFIFLCDSSISFWVAGHILPGI